MLKNASMTMLTVATELDILLLVLNKNRFDKIKRERILTLSLKIGSWSYKGFSWKFRAGGAQWGRSGENAQEEPCPRESEGCPGNPAGGGQDGPGTEGLDEFKKKILSF